MSASTEGVISLVDTSLRDGNQSLWASVGVTTGIAETALAAIDRIGLTAIDFTSSTNLLMGAKAHREDPWERIARARAAAPHTPLSAITTGMRFMSWERASETVMRLSLRLMARHGLRRLQIAEPMNDVASVVQVARWAKEEGFEEVVAATTFTESPVHTDDPYLKAASVFAGDSNIDAVYIKDPGGLLTVERTASLVAGMRAVVIGKRLELHGHCTTGEAPLAYLRAAQHGIDAVHTGIGPLANGTAQPPLDQTVANLTAAGFTLDIDTDAAAEAALILSAAARERGLEPGRIMPFDMGAHRHQVPGGMMGTLRRQLTELNLLELESAVIEEAGRVRADLGYPIMVTPFSQFVGSQALMNVLAERAGQERYSRMPDEVIRFVLGHFGTPVGTVLPEVADRVADSPRARELSSEPDPRGLDELHADYARRMGRGLDEEELLLRLVMSEDVLESVRAAGIAPRWTPPAEVTTPAEFVAALDRLPSWTSVRVVRGADEIALTRLASAASMDRPHPDAR